MILLGDNPQGCQLKVTSVVGDYALWVGIVTD